MSEFLDDDDADVSSKIDGHLKLSVTIADSDASVISDLEYLESLNSLDTSSTTNFDDVFTAQAMDNVVVWKCKTNNSVRSRHKLTKNPCSSSSADCQSSCRGKMQRIMSKNAILARENREKKKHYISNLEMSVIELTEQNRQLQLSCSSMKTNVIDLEQEVSYLRSVIVNQSALAVLLKNIPSCISSVDGDSRGAIGRDQQLTSSSMWEQKNLASCTTSTRADENYLVDHDYTRPQFPIQEHHPNTSTAGVCLHVAGGMVTFELCSQCNERAQRSADILH